jgi:hypothetical protein
MPVARHRYIAGEQLLEATGSDTITTQRYCTVNAGSAANITLPAISAMLTIVESVPYSVSVTVKNLSSNLVTVLPVGSDTIEGNSSALISFSGESLTLLPTSSGWRVV